MGKALCLAVFAGIIMLAGCTDEEVERAAVGGALGAVAGEAAYGKTRNGCFTWCRIGNSYHPRRITPVIPAPGRVCD